MVRVPVVWKQVQTCSYFFYNNFIVIGRSYLSHKISELGKVHSIKKRTEFDEVNKIFRVLERLKPIFCQNANVLNKGLLMLQRTGNIIELYSPILSCSLNLCFSKPLQFGYDELIIYDT